jgi:hypothetical protein
MTATGPRREHPNEEAGLLPPAPDADGDAEADLFDRVADAVSKFVGGADPAGAGEVNDS